MNNVEQEFEAWKLTLPKCGGYGTGCNGDLEGMNHQPDCPMFGKQFATHLDAWRAAYEAGEIAMKEKAAELRESLKLICAEAESWHTMHDHDGNGLVQCDSICALIPRMKAALSGAEEAKK